MAKIPDATSLISGSAPRSQRGIALFDSNAGAGLMHAGKELGRAAAEIEADDEANNQVASARAMLRLKQEEAAMDEAISQNPADYKNIRTQWKERYGKAYDEVKGTITNPKYSRLFDVAASGQFMQSDSRYANVQKGYRKEHVNADALVQTENAKMAIRPDMSDEEYSQLIQMRKALSSGNAPEMGEDWAVKDGITSKKELDAYRLQLMNPDQQYKFTNGQLKRLTPIGTILANELDADGVVREHGDSKGNAIAGINSQGFPAEFKEIQGILKTDGPDAAKEYARKFYQDKIISANGIDKLPADVQDVVADGVTNHGGGFQKKLLEAARNGSSRNELLDMRQVEYDRLASSPSAAENKWDVSKRGWDNRIKGLRETASQGSYQYDPDVAVSIYNQSKSTIAFDLKQEMARIYDAEKMNVIVPSEAFDATIGKARQLGMSREEDALTEAQNRQSAVADFVLLPINQMNGRIKQAESQAQTGDLKQLETLQRYREVRQKKVTALKDDPRSYYEAHGIIQTPQTSILTGDADEIARRRKEAERVREAEGINIPIATSAEVDSIIEKYDNGGDISREMATLGQSLSADERAVIGASFAKKERGAFAIAMATKNPVVSSKILTGSKMESPIKPTDFESSLGGKLVGAVADSQAKNVKDAVFSYYKKRAAEKMNTDAFVDANILDEAVRAVVGDVEPVNIYGGVSSVVIPPDMKSNDVIDRLMSLSQADLNMVGGGGTGAGLRDFSNNRVTPESLFYGNRLLATGDGIYAFINKATGQPLISPDGSLFELNVRKMQPSGKAQGVDFSGARNKALGIGGSASYK